jgi:hypothetical protein
MAGVLPDAVRWRAGKENVGWQFQDAVIARLLAEAGSLLTTGLQPFVEADQLALAVSANKGDLAVATGKTMSYLDSRRPR